MIGAIFAFSFVRSLLFSCYIYFKSKVLILLLGYTPACTAINKYGIGPNRYILDKVSVEDLSFEEASKNVTGSFDTPIDQSIINRLYGFLNLRIGEAVDSNGFIDLLNSQDHENLKRWINTPPINKSDSEDKLPSVPLLFYTMNYIDFTHYDDNENQKISLNDRIARIVQIIGALIVHPSVDVNQVYFGETLLEFLINIGFYPNLAQCLIQRSDFDISKHSSCYHAIATSDDWCRIEGIRFLKVLLQKAYIVEQDEDNAWYETLYWLAEHGYYKMVELLLGSDQIKQEQLKAKSGELIYLAGKCEGRNKSLKTLKFLLNHPKIDVNQVVDIEKYGENHFTALHKLIICDNGSTPAVVKLFVENERFNINAATDRERTAFYYAAIHSNEESLKLFAESEKVNIHMTDIHNIPPLVKSLARKNIFLFLVKLLANKGCFAREEESFFYKNIVYHTLNSPHSDLEYIVALIDAGADVNARGKRNFTPLHIAAEGKSSGEDHIDPRMLECLLNVDGVDVNIQNNKMFTPLHIGVIAKNVETTTILLKDPRINPNIPNRYGHTPFDCALGALYDNFEEGLNYSWYKNYLDKNLSIIKVFLKTETLHINHKQEILDILSSEIMLEAKINQIKTLYPLPNDILESFNIQLPR